MNVILENTVKQLGFINIEAFVKKKLTETLMQDIVRYKSEISFFESKYKLGFTEFEKKYLNKDAKESFERWDDSIKWEAAIHSFNNAEKLLNTLQKEGLTNYHQQRDELTMVNEKAAKYYTNLQNKNNGVHNT